LKPYTVDLRPEVIAAWRQAAARAGINQRKTIEEFFCAFARQHGIDIPAAPKNPKNGSNPQTLDR
jgi:hypothetical protein